MIKKLKPFVPLNIYQQVLLLCSYRTLSDEQKDELINLIKNNNIDWKKMLVYFQENKVKALVLNNLLSYSSEELLPEDVIALKKHMQKTLVANLKKVSQLKKLLNLLNKHNIPSIPWKGPVFSQIIFGQPAIRSFGDLDILINDQHLWKAKDLFIEKGYTPFWKMTKEQEIAYTKHRHSYEFLKDDGIDVELHWKLAKDQYHFQISMNDFWETSEKGSFLGENIQLPSKENLAQLIF